VVVAEDAAAALECLLVELAGPLVLAQLAEIGGEVVRGGEGVRVVGTEDPAAALEGVLVELAGLLVLATGAQFDRAVVSVGEGVGMVVAEGGVAVEGPGHVGPLQC
jgi:hypothetical protein